MSFHDARKPDIVRASVDRYRKSSATAADVSGFGILDDSDDEFDNDCDDGLVARGASDLLSAAHSRLRDYEALVQEETAEDDIEAVDYGDMLSLKATESMLRHHGGKTFTVYKVRVFSNLPQFYKGEGAPQYVVERQYSQFHDFRKAIKLAYNQLSAEEKAFNGARPGANVPHLQAAGWTAVFSGLSSDAEKERMDSINALLSFVARHPTLRVCKATTDFLPRPSKKKSAKQNRLSKRIKMTAKGGLGAIAGLGKLDVGRDSEEKGGSGEKQDEEQDQEDFTFSVAEILQVAPRSIFDGVIDEFKVQEGDTLINNGLLRKKKKDGSFSPLLLVLTRLTFCRLNVQDCKLKWTSSLRDIHSVVASPTDALAFSVLAFQKGGSLTSRDYWCESPALREEWVISFNSVLRDIWQAEFESNTFTSQGTPLIQDPEVYQCHFFLIKKNRSGVMQQRMLLVSSDWVYNLRFTFRPTKFCDCRWSFPIRALKSIEVFAKSPRAIVLKVDVQVQLDLADEQHQGSKERKARKKGKHVANESVIPSMLTGGSFGGSAAAAAAAAAAATPSPWDAFESEVPSTAPEKAKRVLGAGQGEGRAEDSTKPKRSPSEALALSKKLGMKSLYKFVLKDRGEKDVLVHETRRLFYALTGTALEVSIDREKVINTDDGASAGIFRHQAKAFGRVAHRLGKGAN